MERINAFSIAIGSANQGLTERTLEARKNEARRTALAFMPSLRLLLPSVEERLVADGGNLWLSFDLVSSQQMNLALEGASAAGSLVETIRLLRGELVRLREEAGEFVVRVGRLTALANSLPQLDSEHRRAALETLSDDDRATWELMHRRPGRLVSIPFTNDTLSSQLPLFNRYVPESGTRSISAKISAIHANGYELNAVREIAAGAEGSRAMLPASITMDRPRQVDESVRQARFLLHVAEEAGIRVSLRTRVILQQFDLAPAYLEFRGIEANTQLEKALALLTRQRGP